MKEESNIKELLLKFTRNECNKEEAEKVVKYFKDQKRFEEFPTVEEVLEVLQEKSEMNEEESERVYSEIKVKMDLGNKNSSGSNKNEWKWQYAVAAIFIGLIGTFYFSQNDFDFTKGDVVVDAAEEPEYITLQLEDGTVRIIKETETTLVADEKGNTVGMQNGNQLIYSNDSKPAELSYNILTVPYGRKFELELSDGTYVHLNSGTTIKYPVAFLEGQNRQVFLEGEAYFHVTEDKKRPFIVNAGKLDIRVFGTQFNVDAYKEDSSIDVVLVEGSVGLYKEQDKFIPNDKHLLKPGFKGSYNKKQQQIYKKQVETSIYTSWIEGKLVFRNMEFENVLKKLERHYNVTIINKNKLLAESTYTANFGEESIERVLQYLAASFDIKYTLKGNKIIIE